MPSVVARGQGDPLTEAEDAQLGRTDSRHVPRAHAPRIEPVGACDSLAQGNSHLRELRQRRLRIHERRWNVGVWRPHPEPYRWLDAADEQRAEPWVAWLAASEQAIRAPASGMC